jgi:hypothetical protein
MRSEVCAVACRIGKATSAVGPEAWGKKVAPDQPEYVDVLIEFLFLFY